MRRLRHLLLALFFSAGCFLDETIETVASTPAEATAKGAWVPRFVPPSVRDFEETHDLDTNLSYGRFRYEASVEGELLGNLHPLSASQVSKWHWRNKMGGWRPELRSSLGPQLAKEGILLRSAPWDAKHTVFSRYTVVVDARSRIVYFWTE